MSEDTDTREARVNGTALGLGYSILQCRHCCVSLLCLRRNKSKRDQFVWIAQLDEVIPETLVETGERSKDEDMFAVSD